MHHKPMDTASIAQAKHVSCPVSGSVRMLNAVGLKGHQKRRKTLVAQGDFSLVLETAIDGIKTTDTDFFGEPAAGSAYLSPR